MTFPTRRMYGQNWPTIACATSAHQRSHAALNAAPNVTEAQVLRYLDEWGTIHWAASSAPVPISKLHTFMSKRMRIGIAAGVVIVILAIAPQFQFFQELTAIDSWTEFFKNVLGIV